MATTMKLTLIANLNLGPFDLYSDMDSYTTPFETNIARQDLVDGFTSSLVPDHTTSVKFVSTAAPPDDCDIIRYIPSIMIFKTYAGGPNALNGNNFCDQFFPGDDSIYTGGYPVWRIEDGGAQSGLPVPIEITDRFFLSDSDNLGEPQGCALYPLVWGINLDEATITLSSADGVTYLDWSYYSEMTSVELINNTTLTSINFFDENLYEFIITGPSGLITIELDQTSSAGLSMIFYGEPKTALLTLNTGDVNVATIDLTNTPNLTTLYMRGLTTLDISPASDLESINIRGTMSDAIQDQIYIDLDNNGVTAASCGCTPLLSIDTHILSGPATTASANLVTKGWNIVLN